MACSPFDARRRINASTPLKSTPPRSRQRAGSPQRHGDSETSLSVQRIIGTTTIYSNGLTSHYDSNTFAYCAGSAAVLGKVDEQGELSFRYFRAHPNVLPVYPYVSVYNPAATPTGTPEGRRRNNLLAKQGADEKGSISSPRRTRVDEAIPRSWSARERVKAVSCVHLSDNGRFLAVGETGYNPRVNIFSLIEGGSSDIPVTTLAEHTFGVRAVAFSPNSRWLATLGDINDGFLFIWSINAKTGAAKLHYTNKCTASVLDMAWSGNSLITAGIRHVKVWRVGDSSIAPQGKQGRLGAEKDGAASPGPKTLAGRNCRLGDLIDSTFTCVKSISDSESVLCTVSGAVCLLHDRDGELELRPLKHTNLSAQSAAVDLRKQEVHFAFSPEHFKTETLASFRSQARVDPFDMMDQSRDSTAEMSSLSSPSSIQAQEDVAPSRRSSGIRRSLGAQSTRSEGAIRASTCLPNKVVAIDQDRNICLHSLTPDEKIENSGGGGTITLPSNNDTVQGVVSLPSEAMQGDYLTWTVGGIVKFWTLSGSLRRAVNIEIDQPERMDPEENPNELRLVRVSRDGKYLVAGDRFGILQIINSFSQSTSKTRAHGSDITDIALSSRDDSVLVATGARDRTVQLLQHNGTCIELLQTFDEHTAAVNAVSFSSDFLVSASADRTVVVRQQVSRAKDDGPASITYCAKRVITLKASPTSFTFAKSEELVVSTMDKQVLTFNIMTGASLDGFKAVDAEGEDAVVLTSLNVGSIKTNTGSRRVLTGFSSTDKSIRVYDVDLGILLAKELGHTEGISAVVLLDRSDGSATSASRTLISTGLDGLIIVWRISAPQLCNVSTPLQGASMGQECMVRDGVDSTISDSILRRPPQRKLISKLDFAEVNGLEPSVSPIQPRSPPRLKKKTSKQSLALRELRDTYAVQATEEIARTMGSPLAQSSRHKLSCLSPNAVNSQTRSGQGSPSTAYMVRNLSTATDDKRSAGQPGAAVRSPSPSPPLISSCRPVSQIHANRANKGRLRKQPSVPSNLGATSDLRARRRSLGNITESGGIGKAGEKMCHALRAYRKSIEEDSSTEVGSHLNEVEIELLATLRILEKRHAGKDKAANHGFQGRKHYTDQ